MVLNCFPYESVAVGTVAISLNFITVVVIMRIRAPLPPNVRLVCNLIISDLLMAVVVTVDSIKEGLLLIKKSAPNMSDVVLQSNDCVNVVVYSFKQTGSNAILLTLVCLGVDLYVATVYPLNYTRRMNSRRVNQLMAMVWISSFLLGFSNIYIPIGNCQSFEPVELGDDNFSLHHDHSWDPLLTNTSKQDSHRISKIVFSQSSLSTNDFSPGFCYSALMCPHVFAGYFTIFVLLLSSLILTPIYIRILCRIRKFQNVSSRLSRTMRRNWRSLATTLIIVTIFLICYTPYYLAQLKIVLLSYGEILSDVNQTYLEHWLQVLVLLNSALDPLLYAYRMRDIRKAYKNFMYCVFGWRICWSSQYHHSKGNQSGSFSSSRSFSLSQKRIRRRPSPVQLDNSHLSISFTDSKSPSVWCSDHQPPLLAKRDWSNSVVQPIE